MRARGGADARGFDVRQDNHDPHEGPHPGDDVSGHGERACGALPVDSRRARTHHRQLPVRGLREEAPPRGLPVGRTFGAGVWVRGVGRGQDSKIPRLRSGFRAHAWVWVSGSLDRSVCLCVDWIEVVMSGCRLCLCVCRNVVNRDTGWQGDGATVTRRMYVSTCTFLFRSAYIHPREPPLVLSALSGRLNRGGDARLVPIHRNRGEQGVSTNHSNAAGCMRYAAGSAERPGGSWNTDSDGTPCS